MTLYAFGPFQLDGSARRLTRDGAEVVVSDRHLEVLLQLVQQPGTIITKNALIDAAWGDVAVTDNSLEQAISGLRRALGDASGRPLIETVPRRGYRFAGDVHRTARRESDEGLAALLAPHQAWLEGRAILELLDREKVSAAEAAFRRALAALPDVAAPHIGMANACAFRFEATRSSAQPDMQSLAEALSHAQDACRLEPELAESWATLGFVLSRAGSPGALAASRRAVALEPDNWRHQLRLAFVGWGEERLRAAARALRLLPGLGLAHFLAATVHVARQSFDAAERELEAGLTAQPAQPAGEVRFGAVGLHWLRGLVRLQAGDIDSARSELQQEIASNAGHLYAAECCANVRYALGAMAWRSGDRASGAAEFDAALGQASGHPLAGAARMALSADDERERLAPVWTARLARLRSAGLSIDAAIAEAIPLVLSGDAAGGAAHVRQACADAPPGSQGWLLPLDPLLQVTAHEAEWSGALALIRTRAA